MLKNYLKIAIRTILKQKLFSFINVFSLSVGLTCTILIYLFIHDELSFDQFNENKDSIYRVAQRQNAVDGSLDYNGLHHAISLGPSIVGEVSGVERSARFFRPFDREGLYVRRGDLTLREEVLYADFEVFDMFTFPFIEGDLSSLLPNQVVLSERAAQKYFGNSSAVGENISVRIQDEFVDFTVSAVVANIPSASSIQFDILLNFRYLTEVGYLKQYADNWGFGAIITYVQLNELAEMSVVESGMNAILGTHYPNYKSIAEQRGYKTTEGYRKLVLQPLTGIHFDTSVTRGLVMSSNKLYSFILLAIAIGILAIGCINFMNLSIARSSSRAKEVGLRKAIGANRKQLVVQFLGESVLLSMIGFILAIFTADLLLPLFNLVTGKHIDTASLISIGNLSVLLSIALFTGIISGVYPAFALSSFKIQDSFSGKLKIGGTNRFTRILVVIQFSLSTLLIIGMIGITKQMQYVHKKDLGFKGDHVIVIPNNTLNQTTMYGHFKNSIQSHSGVISMSSADQTFGRGELGGRGFSYKGEDKRIGVITVSPNYIETLSIELQSGRDFNTEMNSDFGRTVIVNEAAFKDFQLEMNEPFEDYGRTPADFPSVVGLMQDFNYNSLSIGVLPMMIVMTNEEDLGYIFIKISPENSKETLTFLGAKWSEVAPDLPFEYTFLDETIAAQYQSEERWGRIMTFSMIMAIILSSAGLFGLVAMAILGKKSEIGIRKILGAPVSNIVMLYSWRYTRLVSIAFVLAIPVSYYALEKWLSGFAYRVELGVGIYLIGALVVIGIALLTVFVKIIEAATENPINVIRNE